MRELAAKPPPDLLAPQSLAEPWAAGRPTWRSCTPCRSKSAARTVSPTAPTHRSLFEHSVIPLPPLRCVPTAAAWLRVPHRRGVRGEESGEHLRDAEVRRPGSGPTRRQRGAQGTRIPDPLPPETAPSCQLRLSAVPATAAGRSRHDKGILGSTSTIIKPHAHCRQRDNELLVFRPAAHRHAPVPALPRQVRELHQGRVGQRPQARCRLPQRRPCRAVRDGNPARAGTAREVLPGASTPLGTAAASCTLAGCALSMQRTARPHSAHLQAPQCPAGQGPRAEPAGQCQRGASSWRQPARMPLPPPAGLPHCVVRRAGHAVGRQDGAVASGQAHREGPWQRGGHLVRLSLVPPCRRSPSMRWCYYLRVDSCIVIAYYRSGCSVDSGIITQCRTALCRDWEQHCLVPRCRSLLAAYRRLTPPLLPPSLPPLVSAGEPRTAAGGPPITRWTSTPSSSTARGRWTT